MGSSEHEGSVTKYCAQSKKVSVMPENICGRLLSLTIRVHGVIVLTSVPHRAELQDALAFRSGD
jgi:hypothetical protein